MLSWTWAKLVQGQLVATRTYLLLVKLNVLMQKLKQTLACTTFNDLRFNYLVSLRQSLHRVTKNKNNNKYIQHRARKIKQQKELH